MFNYAHVKKTTRPLRLKIIKILSLGAWERLSTPGFPLIEDIPRGSTLYAIEHFKDRPITFCEVGVEKGDTEE